MDIKNKRSRSLREGIFESGIDLFTTISIFFIAIVFIYSFSLQEEKEVFSAMQLITPEEIEIVTTTGHDFEMPLDTYIISIYRRNRVDTLILMTAEKKEFICENAKDRVSLLSCLDAMPEFSEENLRNYEVHIIDNQTASNEMRLALIDFFSMKKKPIHRSLVEQSSA